jgi:hypothetical protein
LSAIAAAEEPARKELQDIVRRFAHALDVPATAEFRDLRQLTDRNAMAGETWICGEIDRAADGSWVRFYIPPKGEIEILPHATLDLSYADSIVEDCSRTAAEFRAGQTTRDEAKKACAAAIAVGEARSERLKFELDYKTWCELGSEARQIR